MFHGLKNIARKKFLPQLTSRRACVYAIKTRACALMKTDRSFFERLENVSNISMPSAADINDRE